MNTSRASKPSNIYYGWWIVLVSAIGLCFGFAPIVVYSFSVFIKPLAQELHSNRASISLAFTLANLMSCFSSLILGRLVDRFGARRVILAATVLLASLMLSARFLPAKLSSLYVFYGLLGLVGSGAAPIPYGKVVARWFDRRRGLALGITMCGIGTGAILMPPLCVRLIAEFGWRYTFGILGILILMVCLPVVGLLLREAPEVMGLLPDGEVMSAPRLEKTFPLEGMAWREARRTQAFWVILAAISLVGASVHSCIIHLTPLLNDAGASPNRVALATTILGIALLIGRLGSGYLLDRFFAPRVAMCLFGAAACGIALMRVGAASGLVYLASFLVGLGMGAEVDTLAFLVSRYFGMRSFGELYGYGFAAFTMAGALGPLLMGLGFDRYGSYGNILIGLVVATLAAVALLTRLGPYRYRHEASDSGKIAQVNAGTAAVSGEAV